MHTGNNDINMIQNIVVGFEILTAVVTKSSIFWVAMNAV
jgi:hypothetical protein